MLTKVQQVSFVKQPYIKGSGCDFWNVDLDGKPFGQIRKFRNNKTDRHPFTAIALSGEFGHFLSLEAAMDYMRGLM